MSRKLNFGEFRNISRVDHYQKINWLHGGTSILTLKRNAGEQYNSIITCDNLLLIFIHYALNGIFHCMYT